MWKETLAHFRQGYDQEADLLRTTFRLLQQYANAYYVVPRDLRSALGPAAHPFLEEERLRALSPEEAKNLPVERMATLVHAAGPVAYGPPGACTEEAPPGDAFPVYSLVDNRACFRYLIPIPPSSLPVAAPEAVPRDPELRQGEDALRSAWKKLAEESSELRFAVALCSARSEAFSRVPEGWANGAAAQYIVGGLAGPSAGVYDPWLLQETTVVRRILQALPRSAEARERSPLSVALAEKLYGRYTKSAALRLGGLSVDLLNVLSVGLSPGALLPRNTAKAEDLTVAPGLAIAQRNLGAHLGPALNELAAPSPAQKPPLGSAALRSWCYRKMLHAPFPKTERECRAYLRSSAEHLRQDWEALALRGPVYERVGFPRKELSGAFEELSPLAQRYALLWLLGALSHAPARPEGIQDDVLPRWVALTRPWPTAEQLPTLRFVCHQQSVFKGREVQLELPPAGSSDAHVSPLLLAAFSEKLAPEKIAALARDGKSENLRRAVETAGDYVGAADRSSEREELSRAAVWFYRRFRRVGDAIESQTADRAEDAVEKAISFCLTREQRDTMPPSAVAQALQLTGSPTSETGDGESWLSEGLRAHLKGLPESRRRDEEASLRDYCAICQKALPELSQPEWDEYAVADAFFRRLRTVPARAASSGDLSYSLQTAGKLLFTWKHELRQSRVWDASVGVERGVFDRFGEPAAAVALRAAGLWEQAEAKQLRGALGCASFMVLGALRASKGPEPQYALEPDPRWTWAVIGPGEIEIDEAEETSRLYRAASVDLLPERSQLFDAILVTSPRVANPELLWKSLRLHGFVYVPPTLELQSGVYRGEVGASEFEGFGPRIAELVRRNRRYEVYTAPDDNSGTPDRSEAWLQRLSSSLASSAAYLRRSLEPDASDAASFEPPARGLSHASAVLQCSRGDLEEELRANTGATTVTVRGSDLVYLGEEAVVRKLVSESSLPVVEKDSHQTGWLSRRAFRSVVDEVFIPDMLLNSAGDSDAVCVAVGVYLGTLWYLETRADRPEAKASFKLAEELWARYVAAKPDVGRIDLSARIATLLCRREVHPDLLEIRRELDAWGDGKGSLEAQDLLKEVLLDLGLSEAQVGFSAAEPADRKLRALSAALSSPECRRFATPPTESTLEERFLVGTSCNDCDAGMSCCAAVAQVLSQRGSSDASIQSTADELYARLIAGAEGEAERPASFHELAVVLKVLQIYAELAEAPSISVQVAVYEATAEGAEDLMRQAARETTRYSVGASQESENIPCILRVLSRADKTKKTLAFLPLWEAAPPLRRENSIKE